MLCNVSQQSSTLELRVRRRNHIPSLVMKEINSLTHSCMHSFASLAILAFSGKAVFMIRATGAKLRMLASEMLEADDDDNDDRCPCCLDDADLGWQSDDMMLKLRAVMLGEWVPSGPELAPVVELARCDANHGLSRRAAATNERVASLEQVQRRTLGFAQLASSVPGAARRGIIVTQGSNKSNSTSRSGRICMVGQVEGSEGDAKGSVRCLKGFEEISREKNQPFAIGSHRSCSLTSNSPKPVPCAPSGPGSIWSCSSPDCALCSTSGSLGGEVDMM